MIAHRYYLSAFIFVMCGCTVEKEVSSLKDLYVEARELSAQKPAEALKVIDAHNTLARSVKEKEQLGDGYFLKAWIHLHQGDADNALVNYYNALLQYKDVDQFEKQTAILKNIGSLFHDAKSYEIGLKYYREALAAATLAQSKKEQASIYYNLGLGYQYLSKFDSAGYYFFKSLDMRKALDDVAGQAKILNDIGILHYELGQYDKAREYYEKVRLMIEGDPDYLSLYSDIVNNIGNSLIAENRIAEAKPFIVRGLKLMQAAGNEKAFTIAYNNLGLILTKEGKMDSARLCFTKSIASNLDYHNSGEILVSWQNLEGIFETLGQRDSAYHYSKLINEITLPVFQERDQLERDSQKYRLELINAEYLNQQIRKTDAKQRLALIFIFTGVFLCVLLALATWYVSVKRQGVNENVILKYLPESLRFRLELILRENTELKKTLEEWRKTRMQARMKVDR